jgi:hypothetical protein
MQAGSVITKDNGIKILAMVAAERETCRKRIFPDLLQHLATCRPKDVPQHAEKIVVAVNAKNRDEFSGVLQTRMVDLSATQTTRVRKVIKDAAQH